MRLNAPISHHRLRRTFAWARLCLVRIAACLAEQSFLHAVLPRAWRRALEHEVAILADIAAALVFLSACARLPVRHRPKQRRPALTRRGAKLRNRSGEWRALKGFKLRRALRARTLGVRITAILNLLRDPEPAIADFVRRLQRGFTRRCGVLLTYAARPAPPAPRFGAPLCADTS